MFGIQRAATNQAYQDTLPMPMTHDAGGGVTYIGYCEKLGTKFTDPKWLIIRITVAGGITTPEYARGSAKFDNIWDDRTTLDYSR